jgi:hypothetical protein
MVPANDGPRVKPEGRVVSLVIHNQKSAVTIDLWNAR